MLSAAQREERLAPPKPMYTQAHRPLLRRFLVMIIGVGKAGKRVRAKTSSGPQKVWEPHSLCFTMPHQLPQGSGL